MGVEVLTVSSKGQVVLPVDMRRQLGIGAGSKIAAYMADDIIMLKVIKVPTVEEFREDLKAAQAWAQEVGYKEEDVDDIIHEVRKKNK